MTHEKQVLLFICALRIAAQGNSGERNLVAVLGFTSKLNSHMENSIWYDNIEPTKYDTNAYKEVLHLINRNEGEMQATMTDKHKERFS